MPSDAELIIRAIANTAKGKDIRLMEVCGTHTMSIARSGIKSLLPENIKLLSGPGCPVCVAPPEIIDLFLELSLKDNVIIASYGDMLRVPGSTPGDSLMKRRALGAKVSIVYSPVDAVELAAGNPDKEIVFLGVGFETTAPGTAAAVLTAKKQGIKNFSVLTMLKTVEPSLRALIASEGFSVDGFLCPGHVGTIIGEKGFAFLPDEFGIPAAIAGFEPEEILLAIFRLVKQVSENRPRLENCYRRAVSSEGNTKAFEMIKTCFEPCGDSWRGLGRIEGSGLKLKKELSEYDAALRFRLDASPAPKKTVCACGDVITGRISPAQCPLFGTRCLPEDPVGPCMVSSEGACAAAYKYQSI